MMIYHIVPTEVWQEFGDAEFEPDSLLIEGFIHCSFRDQLDVVIQRYYGDRQFLTILEIDTSKLTSKLVVESSTGGEHYPHIYGTINKDAVINIEHRKKP